MRSFGFGRDSRKSLKGELPALLATLLQNIENQLPEVFCNIPFRRDPHFVGREALLDQIRGKCSVPASCVALVGLGGVG